MSSDGGEVRLCRAATVIGSREKIIFVEFEVGDKRNPQNFPLLKKWAITLTACYFFGMTAAAASSYSISIPSMAKNMHCTELEASLGLGLYAMGFGIMPLISSSFSEEVGRRPVYIFSSITFAVSQIMISLAPNMGVVITGRIFEGVFGGIGTAMVGGSIADIWRSEERGFPMSIFGFTTIFALGLGSAVGGVIESSLSPGWRWVQWIHVMVSCIFVILVLVVLKETRSSVILMQIARSQRKLTGINTYKAKAEIDKESFWSLVKTSCTRPLYFLATEPIVQSVSIWCGFTWGVVYCLLEAVTPMFQTVYGFNVRQTGYVFITSSIGAIIGVGANMYQDRLYKRHYARKKQEARLYAACIAALYIPIGMFAFAWTASPKIHWILPIIGLTMFMSGTMVIFQVTLLYLADCYNTYASSAQAGQSLFRNLMALVFPLFTQRMFAALTYRWTLTLFAILGLILALTPFILYFYGSKIRERSIASQRILAADVLVKASSLPSHPSETLPSSSESASHPRSSDNV